MYLVNVNVGVNVYYKVVFILSKRERDGESLKLNNAIVCLT